MAFLRKRGRVWYGVWWEGKGKERRQRWKAFSPIKSEADSKLNDLNEIVLSRRYGHRIINISWDTFSEEYLRLTIAKKRPDSRSRDASTLKIFREMMPSYKMAEITPKVLEDYIAQRKVAGVKDSTVNREIGTLKHMTNCARKWGYLSKDPWADISQFNIESGPPKFFEEKENREIYDFCADAYERVIHDLGTLQGLRPGEMANLLWEDANFKGGVLVVSSAGGDRLNPKKRTRVMQLHPQTRKDLKDLKREASCAYVMGLHERQMPSRYIARVYKRVLERCGQKGSIYWTRHTFGTTLASGNIHQRTIQDLMGHSRITTTQGYMHPVEKSKRDAIRGLPGHG